MHDTHGRHFDEQVIFYDKMLYKMCHRFRLTKRDDIFDTFEASLVFYAKNAQLSNKTKRLSSVKVWA